MPQEILIVDDEKDIRFLLKDSLEDEGYACRESPDDQTLVREMRQYPPSLVLLDIWLQGSDKDGIELLSDIKREYPDVPVVMMSGHGNIETAVKAIKLGAYDYIEKPIKLDRLLVTVRKALEHGRLVREHKILFQQQAASIKLVGSSPQITQLRQTIKKIAPTNSRVLITGAAGTGKEVVARQIHFHSRRVNGPFVVLSCANMAPEQIEREVFGFENKANHLEKRQVGVLEEAHGGTLYLDEVADLPIDLQAKILVFLQDNEFQRVGSGQNVKTDIRVISSTTCDLKPLIESGKFRADLFYRLNVVPLSIPTIFERLQDIPELVAHLLKTLHLQSGLPDKKMSDAALATLQTYEWPGNVRQLKNVLEWMLIMSPENAPKLEIGDLPPEIVGENMAQKALEHPDLFHKNLREAREIFEREYLLAQVKRFGGNISKTAQYVGMERSALHRKLKMLTLVTDAFIPSDEEPTEALALEEKRVIA